MKELKKTQIDIPCSWIKRFNIIKMSDHTKQSTDIRNTNKHSSQNQNK